ncbi:MAG: hypothetical protein M0024_04065 [Nitrospiraceae bacterium]|nr:hypothetical protein [Nitrospiraceae bacterium]
MTKQNISRNIEDILAEGELDEEATVKNCSPVQIEGAICEAQHSPCNLNMILAVGER